MFILWDIESKIRVKDDELWDILGQNDLNVLKSFKCFILTVVFIHVLQPRLIIIFSQHWDDE